MHKHLQSRGLDCSYQQGLGGLSLSAAECPPRLLPDPQPSPAGQEWLLPSTSTSHILPAKPLKKSIPPRNGFAAVRAQLFAHTEVGAGFQGMDPTRRGELPVPDLHFSSLPRETPQCTHDTPRPSIPPKTAPPVPACEEQSISLQTRGD